MTKDIDLTGHPVQNLSSEEGVEAILRAMKVISERSSDAVQVIAKFDVEGLVRSASVRDALFQDLVTGALDVAAAPAHITEDEVEKAVRGIVSNFLGIAGTEIGEYHPYAVSVSRLI